MEDHRTERTFLPCESTSAPQPLHDPWALQKKQSHLYNPESPGPKPSPQSPLQGGSLYISPWNIWSAEEYAAALFTLAAEENQKGDEREQDIRLRSFATSAALGGVICMLLVMIESFLFDRSTAPIWIIYCGMMFSKSIMDAVKIKKRSDIGLSVVWGLCSVLHIILYILDNFGWCYGWFSCIKKPLKSGFFLLLKV